MRFIGFGNQVTASSYVFGEERWSVWVCIPTRSVGMIKISNPVYGVL